MWDEKDHTARWIQGICAILLGLFALIDAHLLMRTAFVFFYFIAGLLFWSARLGFADDVSHMPSQAKGM